MATPPTSPRPSPPPANGGDSYGNGQQPRRNAAAAAEGVNARFEGSPPPSSPLVYPTQVAAAEQLASRIKDRLAMKSDTTRFRGLWGVILTPSSLSLRAQTQGRLDEFKRAVEPLLSNVTCAGIVNGKAFRQMCTTLLSRVQDEPHTLFVVVHDEAHYGVAQDSVLDKELLSALIAVGKQHENVVYIAVSATPWVLLDKHTFVRRATNLVEYTPPKEYSGLVKLVNSVNWVVDDSIADEVELLNQYVAAFNAESDAEPSASPSSPKFAQRAVRSLLSKTPNNRCLVVIRIPVLRGQGSAEDRANVIVDGLRSVCSAHGITLINGAVGNQTQWNRTSDAMVSDNNVILVVAKRFHTGDTFPSHFSFLDERLCLSNDSVNENLVKAHQELGRAYGYGRRPHVAVSSTTDAVIRSIPVSAKEVLDGKTSFGTPHKYMIASQQSANSGGGGQGSYFVPHNRCLFSRSWDDASTWFLDARFVLCAQPQSGKTGVVLWTLKLLAESVMAEQPPPLPEAAGASNVPSAAPGKPLLQVTTPQLQPNSFAPAEAPAAPVPPPNASRVLSAGALRTRLAYLKLNDLRAWTKTNQINVNTNVGGHHRRTKVDFVDDIMTFLRDHPDHSITPPPVQ